ncbi:nuclear export factor CRM1 [Histomonas meleagridis]|uniref:nuclear export factor CRM1 n=1 Tax=Histomonas meleagridis TaxID=135588 RepID=UPI003559D8E8|nr:nuclear export factor CRM1 [Histomonas meleagridis]KAH0802760.1 nuclear export factor CRM1 [Histomonas meleagridis]
MELLSTEGTPVDIPLFDEIVQRLYYQAGTPVGIEAHEALLKFKQRSDAWIVSQQIISLSQSMQSRFVALEIFYDGAQKYWSSLPDEQKQYFKKFYFELIFRWSNEMAPPQLLSAANQVLIIILKNEWPMNWPSFMHDFLQTCKTTRSSALNGLSILSILSEEIHEYTDEMITSNRQSELSRALDNDFTLIFSFIEELLKQDSDIELMKQTLVTLSHYLRWINLDLVIQSPLCRHMVVNLFPNPNFRFEVLLCFESIGQYSTAEKNMYQIFEILVGMIQRTLGESHFITDVYQTEEYVRQLILTLGHFLVLDHSVLLLGILSESAVIALSWLVQLTMVAQPDSFKIAVEYWLSLSKIFFLEQHKVKPPNELIFQLQRIFIQRMAKPPEFTPLLQYDIEEAQPDLYENMRSTLVCFSNLSRDSMEQLLYEHLRNAQNVNEILRASWAIGAISGSFPRDREQVFVYTCLDIIIKYIELQSNEQCKALVCGCYMFVCSVYPRFLFNNWPILKQLTDKIAFFLQIKYPPLQVMTVNIFKTLISRCYKPLLQLHPGQQKSFLNEWLDNISLIASQIPMESVPVLYESIALLIKYHPNLSDKPKFISQLLVIPLQSWERFKQELTPDNCCEDNISMQVMFPIHIFSKILLISDFAYFPQMIEVVKQTIDLCNFYTSEIHRFEGHPNLIRTKTILLELFESFFEANPRSDIVPNIITSLMNDYNQSDPRFRYSQILDCFTTLILKLGDDSSIFLNDLFVSIIQPTFDMIKDSFDSYPDIRLSHFRLLSVILSKVFSSLRTFQSDTFSMLLNCLLWGVSHPVNEISTLAFNCVSNLISDIDVNQDQEFKQIFYDTFFMPIVFELFSVMTDRAHKFIFSPITRTLQHLFLLIHSHKVILCGNQDSENFLANELTLKLMAVYPQHEKAELLEFSRSLIMYSTNYGQFKESLRSFLIGIKKVSPHDIELYSEELAQREMNEIYGLAGPAEPTEYFEGEETISEF